MHRTVLRTEAVDALALREGSVVIDGTLGAGGHVEEIVERFGSDVRIIAIDLDDDAIERARARIGDRGGVSYHLGNFADMAAIARSAGVERVDGILLDLGWSMDQFEAGGRGFSFKRDEPLSMTLKKTIGPDEFDAKDIVNGWAEEDIGNVIYHYGEERFARRIAREIIEARETQPIATSAELAAIVERAVPFFYKRGRIHPATKTFQALRIAVNDELRTLERGLLNGFHLLNQGGRMAVISFHSLEDRIIKNFFRTRDKEGDAELVTKKPILASDEELRDNPRSRSAKLRVIKKL